MNEHNPRLFRFDTSVGPVRIENNSGPDFKDLRGMRRNTKSLKNNEGERKGILIAPLMRPRLFRPLKPLCFLAVLTT